MKTVKQILSVSLLAVAALVTMPTQADPTTNAPSFTFGWDRSLDPSVITYSLYWGPATRFYTNSLKGIPVATPTATVGNLPRNADLFFAATAVSTNGLESAFSNEVHTNTFAIPPAPLAFKVISAQP